VNSIKTFKEFLAERNAFLTSTMNRRTIFVYNTSHSNERKIERDISDDEIKETLNQGIEWLSLHENEFKDKKTAAFLFYSNSKQVGIVCDFKVDKKISNSLNKHLFIITILPKGKHIAKLGTQKIIVESAEYTFDIFVSLP
jgi:hypothetical protein